MMQCNGQNLESTRYKCVDWPCYGIRIHKTNTNNWSHLDTKWLLDIAKVYSHVLLNLSKTWNVEAISFIPVSEYRQIEHNPNYYSLYCTNYKPCYLTMIHGLAVNAFPSSCVSCHPDRISCITLNIIQDHWICISRNSSLLDHSIFNFFSANLHGLVWHHVAYKWHQNGFFNLVLSSKTFSLAWCSPLFISLSNVVTSWVTVRDYWNQSQLVDVSLCRYCVFFLYFCRSRFRKRKENENFCLQGTETMTNHFMVSVQHENVIEMQWSRG